MITTCCACLMLNMWLQPVRMPKVLTVIVNLGGSFQGNFFPIWYLRLVKSQHFRLSMWQVPHHRSWPTSASSRLLGLRQMQVPFRLQTAMHQSYLKSVSGLRQPGSQCTRFPSENSSLSQIHNQQTTIYCDRVKYSLKHKSVADSYLWTCHMWGVQSLHEPPARGQLLTGRPPTAARSGPVCLTATWEIEEKPFQIYTKL